MFATQSFVLEKFIEFNKSIFDGSLPLVPIKTTGAKSYMGQLRFSKKRSWLGKIEYFDFKISISHAFDLSQQEIEDTLIHEMIHLYIHSRQIEDTSPHGKVFRAMMAKINLSHKRNITISHKKPASIRRNAGLKKKYFYICEILLKDKGRYILSVARSRIFEIDKFFKSHPECVSLRWWVSFNPRFEMFPICRAPKLFNFSREEFDKYLSRESGAVECECIHNVFRPVGKY